MSRGLPYLHPSPWGSTFKISPSHSSQTTYSPDATKTTIYRRHAGKCPIKDQPLNTANCECPLWIHGKVRGKFLRESLDTRTPSAAEQPRASIEQGRDDDPTPDGTGPRLVGATGPKGDVTLEYAAAEFLKTTTDLALNTKRLYNFALKNFCAWVAKQEIVALKSIDSGHLRQYFDAQRDWKRGTVRTRLIHLRVFFNWCVKTKRWIQHSPTADKTLNHRGKKNGAVRQPFTPDEVTQVFGAVERMPEDIRDRARALIYLLLYSGMRISDATFCERSYLAQDGTLDYYVIKTRRPISLALELNERAVAALDKLPPSRIYFFQPDRDDDYREARMAMREGEEFAALMPNYEARVREMRTLVDQVLKVVGIGGACHIFRDTFAINLLVGDGEKGTDIFTVSKMLGHSDVKITDQHYMKLVPGYRERMSKSTRVLSYRFPEAS